MRLLDSAYLLDVTISKVNAQVAETLRILGLDSLMTVIPAPPQPGQRKPPSSPAARHGPLPVPMDVFPFVIPMMDVIHD
jgi:hypothetical protein